MNCKKLYNEMKQKILDMHKVVGRGSSIETDTKMLNAYSAFVNSKVNKSMLNTIRYYNVIMVVFGVINIILFCLNVLILANKI